MRKLLTALAVLAVVGTGTAQARSRVNLTVGAGSFSADKGDTGSGLVLGINIEEQNRALGGTLKALGQFGDSSLAYGKAVIFKDIVGRPNGAYCFSVGGGFGYISTVVQNIPYTDLTGTGTRPYGIAKGAGLVAEARLDVGQNLTFTVDYMSLNAQQIPAYDKDATSPSIDVDGRGIVFTAQYYKVAGGDGGRFFEKTLGRPFFSGSQFFYGVEFNYINASFDGGTAYGITVDKQSVNGYSVGAMAGLYF